VNREVTLCFFHVCIVRHRDHTLSDILTYDSCFQEDFFMILHEILSQIEDVTELQPVPDAHVPVMKFKLHGISIDLLYASVSLLVVSDVSIF
jgi:poly(A) polymerase Pap1